MNRYYGQWEPPVDEVLYENYFKNISDGFFVDCGASNGLLHSCTKFFEDSGWDGVCIEPSAAFSELVESRKVQCLNLALSDRDALLQFNQAVHAIGSSVGLPTGGAVDYIPELKSFVTSFGYVIEPITVQSITYKSLQLPSVDLLVIDVEGHELSVLDGVVGAITLPKVICIEYPITGINRITKSLIEMGYRFDFISFNNAFFSIGIPEVSRFGETEPMVCYRDE